MRIDKEVVVDVVTCGVQKAKDFFAPVPGSYSDADRNRAANFLLLMFLFMPFGVFILGFFIVLFGGLIWNGINYFLFPWPPSFDAGWLILKPFVMFYYTVLYPLGVALALYSAIVGAKIQDKLGLRYELTDRQFRHE